METPIVIWGEGLKHPCRSPGWGSGKTLEICIGYRIERPSDWGGAAQLTTGCPAPVLGTHRGRCARRGPPPPGVIACLCSHGQQRGLSPLPSSRAAGYLADLSPPLLQYHTHGTLVSPGKGQSGNKGVFVHRLPGGGSCVRSRFLAPLGDEKVPRFRASPSPLHRPPRPRRLRSGRGAPGHRRLFPGGVGGETERRRLAGSAAHEGTVGGFSELAEVAGAGEGACAGLSLEVRCGLRERSRGCSCPSRGGWNPLPGSFHPPPSLVRPHRRAGPPSPAVIALPFSLLGTFLSNHPSGQTLMENFTPRWKNAGYERITGAPKHLPGHHRHPF